MTVLHNAYLNFDGVAEEAMRFYAAALRKPLERLTRFGDMPYPGMTEADAGRVMHVSIPLGNGQALMASDMNEGFGKKLVVGNNVYVSLHPDTVEEGKRLFSALSEGGTVEAPFGPAPWGDHWGSLRDRFGVQWMINVAGEA